MTARRRSTFLALALLTALFAFTPRLALAAEPEHAGASAGATGAHAEEEKPNLLRPANESLITAITTLIVFLILVAVLGKFAWGPIATGLKAREDKIRKDIADAEATRARAEATLREYNTKLATAEGQIRELLSKATADAENIATNIRARAQQESEEIKERANRDIETARDQAIGQIHNEAVNLATNIAEKILHRNLNPDDQRDLLARSLEQLQTISRN
jgi:F-type H+-transporting ATPase subunit b